MESAARGCIVLERPDLVKAVVTKHTAKDSTIRQTAMAEIESMTPRSSQWREGEEIPEKHWMYRLAKRHWFNDFGTYAKPGKRPPARSGATATATATAEGERR